MRHFQSRTIFDLPPSKSKSHFQNLPVPSRIDPTLLASHRARSSHLADANFTTLLVFLTYLSNSVSNVLRLEHGTPLAITHSITNQYKGYEMREQILKATTKMELYKLAGSMNNHPKHIKIDKVTCMGFMDLEEARRHTLQMLNEIEGV